MASETDWSNLIKAYGGIGPNGTEDLNLSILQGTLSALLGYIEVVPITTRKNACNALQETVQFLMGLTLTARQQKSFDFVLEDYELLATFI
jgi:hypothetical protein